MLLLRSVRVLLPPDCVLRPDCGVVVFLSTLELLFGAVVLPLGEAFDSLFELVRPDTLVGRSLLVELRVTSGR